MENKGKFIITGTKCEIIKNSYQRLPPVLYEGPSLYSFPVNLFNFFSRPTFSYSLKAAKLHQVESRLGMSRNMVLAILSDAGYKIPNKANYSLTYDHLYVLAKAYEKSLRQLFKRSKKQVRTLDYDSLLEQANLFSAFIEDSYKFDSVELFDQELNSSLIERWVVDRAVADIEQDEFDRSFFILLRKLKFKLQRLYRDLRIQILSIILSHHYHVFPSEEDSSEKLNTIKSFSDSLIIWTRKAIVEFNPIKAFKNERYTKFNTTYTTVQLIRG